MHKHPYLGPRPHHCLRCRWLLFAGPSAPQPPAPVPSTLHSAAALGDLEATWQLLAAKMSPNARNSEGETPIHVAAAHGHSAIIEALASAGGNPNLRLPTGATPLHLAASNGHASAVTTLVAVGGDVNAVSEYGSTTPLHEVSTHWPPPRSMAVR